MRVGGVAKRMTQRTRTTCAAVLTLGVLGLVAATGCMKRPVAPAVDAVSGPWEHHTVELADRTADGPLTMHYLAAGPVDGPRVVLLHGFPDVSYGWRGVIPELSSDHRVFAPDLRGYGGTGRPDAGYNVHDIAGDIAAFIGETSQIDGLPAETPVHVVGHDWGAMTGWWLAMDHPELLRTYTALSVPHPLAWVAFLEADEEQRKRATYQDSLARKGVASLLAGLPRGSFAGLYRSELVREDAMTKGDLDLYRRAFAKKADWEYPLRYYQALKSDGVQNMADAEAAGSLTMPVLILWGAEDGFLYPRQAERSCAYVAPGPCEVEVFDEVGHFVMWDAPTRVAQRWRAFVQGLRPSP